MARAAQYRVHAVLRRYARLAYVAFVWLFVAAVLLQVFLAGLALFAGPENWPFHVNFGYLLHVSIVPVTAAALLARLPRRSLWMVAALFVVTAVQPLLPVLRNDVPIVAALHPVLALLVFALAAALAVRAPADVRHERGGDSAMPLRGAS